MLVFVRHAPTIFNDGGPTGERIRGHLDLAVTPEGHAIAQATGESFRGLPVSQVYASDRYAASLIGQHLSASTGAPLTLSPALRSWNLGSLQGQPVASTKDQIKALMRTPDVPAPGGESWHEFVHRYLALLRTLWVQHALILVVTHGRNIMVARAWLAAGAEGDTLDDSVVGADYGTFIRHGGWATAVSDRILDGLP